MATSGPHGVLDLPIRQANVSLVVVETPRGSANKLKYDVDLGAFRLDRVLPAGMSFPFDFGFIPQTLADDGDPLDAIVLLDAPVYPGCVVPARLIGDLEAEQRDGSGPWERNDRLIAVPQASRIHAGIRTIADVDRVLLEAIGAFFVDYHRLDGAGFRVIGQAGVRAAQRAVRQAHRRYVEQPERATSTARSA